jgi:hypothetical protein
VFEELPTNVAGVERGKSIVGTEPREVPRDLESGSGELQHRVIFYYE